MTGYQIGFIRKCAESGVNPAAAAKYHADYLAGREAARRYCEKRAEDYMKVLNTLPPYQRGFAARCTQRGFSVEKVAEFCIRSANKKA